MLTTKLKFGFYQSALYKLACKLTIIIGFMEDRKMRRNNGYLATDNWSEILHNNTKAAVKCLNDYIFKGTFNAVCMLNYIYLFPFPSLLANAKQTTALQNRLIVTCINFKEMVLLLTELFIKALKHPIAAVWILLCLKKNWKTVSSTSEELRLNIIITTKTQAAFIHLVSKSIFSRKSNRQSKPSSSINLWTNLEEEQRELF